PRFGPERAGLDLIGHGVVLLGRLVRLVRLELARPPALLPANLREAVVARDAQDPGADSRVALEPRCALDRGEPDRLHRVLEALARLLPEDLLHDALDGVPVALEEGADRVRVSRPEPREELLARVFVVLAHRRCAPGAARG